MLADCVCKAGLATSQEPCDQAVTALLAMLDRLEGRLPRQRYLTGSAVTEADWRLFTLQLRFDAVHHGHFKCNRRRLVDYPNLRAYARHLYQVPGVVATVRMDHIIRHCHCSHESINPHRIVPIGPELDFLAPQGRA